MMITGSYNKTTDSYRMHSPEFPYNATVYLGYTFEQMKKKYRQDFNLKGKRIEWVIVGM